MFAAKSTLLFAGFAISAQIASAVPPACLLAALNTQSSPADLPTLCGKDSSDVQEQIRKLCGDNSEAALDAYRSTCKAVGKPIPSETSSINPSKTTSVTYKSTSKSKPESTDESNDESTTKANASSSTSVPSVPYPVTYTSTYFDNECSCTKTSTISSTSVIGTSGLVSPTGIATAGLEGLAGPLGSGPGSSATGSPILPSGTKALGSSATPPSYTGAASKNVGALGAGIFVAAALGLAL